MSSDLQTTSKRTSDAYGPVKGLMPIEVQDLLPL